MLINFCFIDEDTDESTDDLYSSETDIDEYSDESNSDMEYTTKKGCNNRKKQRHEEKYNNSKTTNRKKTKKVEPCREVQSNDIRQAASLRSLNSVIPNQIETKGILKVIF